MAKEKNYQALHEDKIFMGSADDVADMVKNERCEVIVDLRGEATECAYPNANARWVQIPLGDDSKESQDVLFQRAVGEVISAYREGKKVAFHCNGGRGRTGAVAVGTLIELGICNSITEAENVTKQIRSVINIKPAQREALEKLYENK